MILSTSQNANATSSAEAAQISPTEKRGSDAEDAPLPEFKTTAPIIYNLGIVKRKTVKKMSNGKGPILDDVERAVYFASEYVHDDGKKILMVPVVLFFGHKRRKRTTWLNY